MATRVYNPLVTVLDRNFPLSAFIGFKVSVPLKLALEEFAASRGMSVADVLREAILVDVPRIHPEFRDIYERSKQENLK